MKQNFISSMTRLVVALSLPIIFFGYSLIKSSPSPKWEQMFNGKDLSGWDIKIRKHDLNDNYNNTFRIKDRNVQVR
ncbi:DUF1080 domain-containing protein [Pedobacter sp. V48]|uniref:DUF1080 domain-containing protein n=1 Tax=Pedobacter sp. V48 TaxID=509635 RepID=UPI0003E47FD5|nr:DUF1080 domain-containing protein [Pedobacter sp. V48]ETZ24914.1 hypothetical protein N824_01395 [Pedobacter sp. V48]